MRGARTGSMDPGPAAASRPAIVGRSRRGRLARHRLSARGQVPNPLRSSADRSRSVSRPTAAPTPGRRQVGKRRADIGRQVGEVPGHALEGPSLGAAGEFLQFRLGGQGRRALGHVARSQQPATSQDERRRTGEDGEGWFARTALRSACPATGAGPPRADVAGPDSYGQRPPCGCAPRDVSPPRSVVSGSSWRVPGPEPPSRREC
jgi:hypothetical protein